MYKRQDTAGISETGAAEDGQAETQPDGEKTGGSEAKTSYPDKTVKIILPYAAEMCIRDSNPSEVRLSSWKPAEHRKRQMR